MLKKLITLLFGHDIENEKEWLKNAIKKSKKEGLKEMTYPLHFETEKIDTIDVWLHENNYRVYFYDDEKRITWHHHPKF